MIPFKYPHKKQQERKLTMTSWLNIFNLCIGVLMSALYGYQIVYTLIALFQRRRKNTALAAETETPPALHRYAVIIPARNERNVIPHLIDSLRQQDYPAELIDLYVIADNCTDDTASVAREAGATVFERFDRTHVGKGYALDYALKEIFRHHDKGYEAFLVFDADNLVDRNFFREMNKTFDGGARIITSYRNSKNFSSSWISSASALWYLRESRFLNAARESLHSSCLISGTGFLVARDILEKNDGWKHHLLTEDIEFSIDAVIHGEKIAFCEKAMTYDEQPISFSQFWIQHLRWAKGFYQVFRHYGKPLARRLMRCSRADKLSCFDLLMMILPAMLITVLALSVNLAALLGGAIASNTALIVAAAGTLANTLISFYLMFFLYGALTLLCERNMFRATAWETLRCLLSFPVFIAAHVPMSVQALFCAVEWKPVVHTCSRTMKDMMLHQ